MVSNTTNEGFERLEATFVSNVATEFRAELARLNLINLEIICNFVICRHTDRVMEEMAILHGVKHMSESVLSVSKAHFDFSTDVAENAGKAFQGFTNSLMVLSKRLDKSDAVTADHIAQTRTNLSAIYGLLTETLKVLIYTIIGPCGLHDPNSVVSALTHSGCYQEADFYVPISSLRS